MVSTNCLKLSKALSVSISLLSFTFICYNRFLPQRFTSYW
ncbi:hypothetical protein 2200_scaffold2352_00051 [Bacteriophage sp.]|nr:hypothetical protein 2200_scaffold2352_00051 [Bacteriophage sp.]